MAYQTGRGKFNIQKPSKQVWATNQLGNHGDMVWHNHGNMVWHNHGNMVWCTSGTAVVT